MKEIIGRKMGMTQVYTEDGTMYAVTVIEVLPNVVTQKKTKDHDGYDAIGIFKKANVATKEFLFELKGDEMNGFEVGQEIKADLFKDGEIIDVIGTSKGRGYAGVIKRWGYKIGPKGHGSGYHRQQGSFANNGRCNNRVIPGKKMSGHMGNQSATVLNQIIVKVDASKNYILVRGGVPGSKKSIVKIRSAVKPSLQNYKVKPVIDRSVKVEAASEAPAQETK